MLIVCKSSELSQIEVNFSSEFDRKILQFHRNVIKNTIVLTSDSLSAMQLILLGVGSNL